MSGFDHVSVTTSDLDASVAFYGGRLEMTVLESGESEGSALDELLGIENARIRFADLDLGEGRVLELIQFVHPIGTPVSKEQWDPGATHIGLRVSDIDSLHGRLRDSGVRVISKPVRLTEEGAWDGARVLYAIDPDGTWVELVQRPDVTQKGVINDGA
ncbi:MAG TPA: VOC family protein [Actinomycetota bacterium]|nr:VOC family protein [Actinomycetota bacterium]